LGFVFKFFRIDDQNPRSGGKADPRAIGGLKPFGPSVRNIPTSRFEQTGLLKPYRMHDFVVPKNIAFGQRGFLFDTGDKTERFGGFDIKDADNLIALLIALLIDRGPLFEIGSLESIEDRGSEFSIGRTVDGR
jgi:hypothetical protein